jgi:tetratricopeptide (TPR) repeat protein
VTKGLSFSFLVSLFGLLVGLVALPAGDAHAQPDPLAKPASPQARQHLTRGNKLYELREFTEAIAAYKAGALIEDAPVFQYNLAQAYRLSAKYQEALWHYDRFVKRTNPTGPLKNAIEQFTAQMKAELEKAASKQQPTGPADGGKDPGAGDGDGADQGGEGTKSATNAPTVDSKPAPRVKRASWPWMVAGGGALALGGAAVGFHLWGNSTYDRAKEATDQAKRDSLEDSANTRRFVAQGLGAAAVVTAGVSVYLYVRSRGSDESPTTALAPVASPQLTGLAFTGSW